MKSQIIAARAVASEYALRLIRPMLWAIIGVTTVLALVVGVLAYTFSNWWLLVLMPISTVAILAVSLWLVVRFLIKRIEPNMSRVQKRATTDYVSKIERVSEGVKTPYFIILFRVLRDVLMNKEQRFLLDMKDDSTTLKKDFDSLSKLF